MGALVGVVSGDLLEIGDESEKEGQVQMAKCKGESEIIQEEEKNRNGIGIRGGMDRGPSSLKKLGENHEVDLITTNSFLGNSRIG